MVPVETYTVRSTVELLTLSLRYVKSFDRIIFPSLPRILWQHVDKGLECFFK